VPRHPAAAGGRRSVGAEGGARDAVDPAATSPRADGLTQREIGACVKVTQGHVVRLLRYHRFDAHWASKIPERTFRAFWNQVRDPAATRGRRGRV
jgi:hypothetical protein